MLSLRGFLKLLTLTFQKGFIGRLKAAQVRERDREADHEFLPAVLSDPILSGQLQARQFTPGIDKSFCDQISFPAQ